MSLTIKLTTEQVEALANLLGDVLDGVYKFDGTTLLAVDPIYEALTHAPDCECGCPAKEMIVNG